MRILKKLFVVLFIVAAGALAAVIFATDRVLEVANPILDKTGFVDAKQVVDFAATAQSELEVATGRGQELGAHTQQVLGAAIEPSSKEQAIHEKAFEYGRYVYCQEVVKSYEAQ